jgi:hypothetical protein
MEKAQTAKGWRNPTIIAAIIGARAALLVAIIGLMPKTKPPETPRVEQPTPSTPAKVEADHGVAAGRDIHGTTITLTNPEPAAGTREPPKGN